MDNIWRLKRESLILILVLGLVLSGSATGAEAKAIGELENQPAKFKKVEIKEAILKDRLQTTPGVAKPEVNPSKEILPYPPKNEIPSGRRCGLLN